MEAIIAEAERQLYLLSLCDAVGAVHVISALLASTILAATAFNQVCNYIAWRRNALP